MSAEAATTEPKLPEAKLNLVKPTEPVTGHVVSTRLCMKGKSASYVRHVAIDVAGTPLAGNFLAGQSFGVIPPGTDDHGKPHAVRLYSIACPSGGEDGQGNVVSTTPKRLIGERMPRKEGDDLDDHRLFLGVCSNYLCDLQVGDEVLLSGPNGKRFLLPVDPAEHDFLFIATGTGIAPFRGMAMELFDSPAGPTKSQVHLVMGTPYTSDLLYDDLFCRLEDKHRNFHYHRVISRELRDGGRPGWYVHQMIDERMGDFRELLESPRTLIYICGLIGMQTGLYRVLARHGLAEPFVTVKAPLDETPPERWETADIKRCVRPTARCMVEVY